MWVIQFKANGIEIKIYLFERFNKNKGTNKTC